MPNHEMEIISEFITMYEKHQIPNVDINQLKSVNELESIVNLVGIKNLSKEYSKQVHIDLDNEKWLVVRPLTYESSLKYGANTKWCTTTEHNQEYYNKYAKRGVLVYCINKKTGYKVAAFYSLDKNEPEFSYWNQKDTRIDSTDSNLPLELIGFIRDYVKDPKVKSNTAMLSGDQKKKELGSGRKAAISERVASAVRRAQEEIEVSEPTVTEESVMEQPELPFYDERGDETEVDEEVTCYRIPEQPESTLDRMQWSSTNTTSETE
jgi:hypothetical protein